jgi:hypothetical protein
MPARFTVEEREYAIVPFGIAGQPRAVPVETIDDISGGLSMLTEGPLYDARS